MPFGKLLFFPLLNAFDVHTPGDGLDTAADVYADFLKFKFRADQLHASVDGVCVHVAGDHRAPRAANSSAVARPMPDAAPVTSTTLPFSP